MAGAADDYISDLPRLRRAALALALTFVAGTGAGAFLLDFFGTSQRLEAHVNDEHTKLQASLDAKFDDLICEINDVPLRVCSFWLHNGRPENLKRSP